MKTLYLFLLLSVWSALSFAQSKKLEGTLYTMEYPSTWQLDTSDPGYDPDVHFIVDASEDNYFMFFIYKTEADPEALVDKYVTLFSDEALTDIFDDFKFKTWGSFTGSGRGLKAKLENGRTAIFRIFSWTTGGKTFLLNAQMLQADSDKWSNGFALIEKSFRLK